MKKKIIAGIGALILGYIGYTTLYAPSHITMTHSGLYTVVDKQEGKENYIVAKEQNGNSYQIYVDDKKDWNRLKEGNDYMIDFETKDNRSEFVDFVPEDK